MNQTDLRADLPHQWELEPMPEKSEEIFGISITNGIDRLSLHSKKYANRACTYLNNYASQVADLQAKLETANKEVYRLMDTLTNTTQQLAASQQRVKELENERDNVRNHFNP